MAKYSKEIVEKICQLVRSDSYTIEEICKNVGINKDTYHSWLNFKPDFSDAIKKAKGEFDELIASEARKSLLKLIQGYEVEEKKTVYVNDKENKPKVKEQTVQKKHFQPNTAAVIFALTNKAPDEYKNRQNTELTGKDGKDLIPETKLEKLSDDDLLKLHELSEKMKSDKNG